MPIRYSMDQMYKLAEALEAAEFSVDDLTKLQTTLYWPFIKELVLDRNDIVAVKRVLAINRIIPFSPGAFIGKDWTNWKGPEDGDGLNGEVERDVCSSVLLEVDITKIRFRTYVNDSGKEITSKERLKRLKDSGDIALDAKVGQELYEEIGQRSLKWLHQSRGVNWMEFPGEALRSPNGRRCFLYLYRSLDGQWGYDCRWLGFDRDNIQTFAVLDKYLTVKKLRPGPFSDL